MWLQVSTAVEARDALVDILPAIVDRYGEAAAALAADWYDQLRDTAGVAGRFAAIQAATGTSGVGALAGWAVGPLFAASPDWSAARTLVAGGLQRRIANAARTTVTRSSVADPQARGWQRVSRGGGCDFCTMLAARGAVYEEATADFASHDHCDCVATPAWKNEPRPVQPHRPSDRNISDADRRRVNRWIAANLT